MKHSLDELKKLAADVFKQSAVADEVYAFADGNIFLPKNKSAAEFHAKQIAARAGNKEPEKYFTITRESLGLSSETTEQAQADAATKDETKAPAVGSAAQPAASGNASEVVWSEKTNAEIKAELTLRGIDSKKATNKEQLLALLNQA